MYALPVVLFAVLDTGTWSVDEMRAWADRQILEAKEVPEWLAQLSLGSDVHEGAKSVVTQLTRYSILPEDVARLLAGLTYLRFRRGEMPREQMISKIGGIVDAYAGTVFDVESWYEQMSAPTEVSADVERIVDQLASEAAAALRRLQDVRSAGDDSFWEPIS
jgi:hypothetical protein